MAGKRLNSRQLEKCRKKFGYKLSASQESVISYISEGNNVFVSKSGPLPYMDSDVSPHRTYEQGRIETYCLGIFNQLDLSGPRCQCLVITLNTGYAFEISEEMKALGGSLKKGVSVKEVANVGEPSSFPHVVVGPFLEMRGFLGGRRFRSGDVKVKLVVFDWGDYFLGHDTEIACTDQILRALALEPRDVQVVVFSQANMRNEIWCENSLLSGVPFFQCHESSVRRCALQGTTNHRFVDIEVTEDAENPINQERKMKCIHDMIGNGKLSEETRTIIVVRGSGNFAYVTNALRKMEIEFASAKARVNQKEKDLMLDKFLHKLYLLITIEIGHRGMSSDLFDSSVHCIIYYDCPDSDDYKRYLGWFSKVGTAVTLAGPRDMRALLETQETHGLVFERIVPSELLADNLHQREERSVKFNGLTHYAYMIAADDSDKVGQLLRWRDKIIIAAGCTSVVFVKSPKSVKRVVKEIRQLVSSYKRAPFVTGSISEAEKIAEKGSSCVFVTCDDAIRTQPDSRINNMKELVYLVINYDLAQSEDDYIHRCDMCQSGGVIIHLVTHEDWFKLFDIQVGLTYPLKKLNEPDIVANLLRYYQGDSALLFEKVSKSTMSLFEKLKHFLTRVSTHFL